MLDNHVFLRLNSPHRQVMWEEAVSQIVLPPTAPYRVSSVESIPDFTTLLERLERSKRCSGIVVILDWSEPDGAVEFDNGRKDYLDTITNVHSTFDFARSVHIASYPHRVRESEKTDAIDFYEFDSRGPKDLTFLLQQALRKCYYITRPISQSQTLTKCPVVTCRQLRYLEEFRHTLRLRKDVYETMQYLSPAFLETKISMEFDWYDSVSIHCGAFVKEEGTGDDLLVGYARLILTSGHHPQSDEWTAKVAKSSQRTMRYLELERQRSAESRLPVFQNFQMNGFERDAAISERPWAELSRVIVKEGWRGMGISHRLVDTMLQLAFEIDVETVLLECLPIHTPIYEQHGFKPLGQFGHHSSISKTLVGMINRLQQDTATLQSHS